VRFHGAFGQDKLLRDLPVGHGAGDQHGDLRFPGGERISFAGGGVDLGDQRVRRGQRPGQVQPPELGRGLDHQGPGTRQAARTGPGPSPGR
jgi:hypothetical protein